MIPDTAPCRLCGNDTGCVRLVRAVPPSTTTTPSLPTLETKCSREVPDNLPFNTISHVWGQVAPQTLAPLPWDVPISNPHKLDAIIALLLSVGGWFWVDIFCIDQHRDHGLFDQTYNVQRMCHVYQKCDTCYVLLSKSDSISFLKWKSLIENISTEGSLDALYDLGVPAPEWSQRVWTLQEAMLPSKHKLCCWKAPGDIPEILTSPEPVATWDILLDNVDIPTKTFFAESLAYHSPGTENLTKWHKVIDFARPFLGPFSGGRPPTCLPTSSIVRSFSQNRKCSVVHDTVYGVANVTGANLIVDYQRPFDIVATQWHTYLIRKGLLSIPRLVIGIGRHKLLAHTNNRSLLAEHWQCWLPIPHHTIDLAVTGWNAFSDVDLYRGFSVEGVGGPYSSRNANVKVDDEVMFSVDVENGALQINGHGIPITPTLGNFRLSQTTLRVSEYLNLAKDVATIVASFVFLCATPIELFEKATLAEWAGDFYQTNFAVIDVEDFTRNNLDVWMSAPTTQKFISLLSSLTLHDQILYGHTSPSDASQSCSCETFHTDEHSTTGPFCDNVTSIVSDLASFWHLDEAFSKAHPGASHVISFPLNISGTVLTQNKSGIPATFLETMRTQRLSALGISMSSSLHIPWSIGTGPSGLVVSINIPLSKLGTELALAWEGRRDGMSGVLFARKVGRSEWHRIGVGIMEGEEALEGEFKLTVCGGKNCWLVDDTMSDQGEEGNAREDIADHSPYPPANVAAHVPSPVPVKSEGMSSSSETKDTCGHGFCNVL
ncbi:hypothetical protein HK097_006471 [Rhizophlyctis rosea]|uniref:Heterokaryon incompatibility domain-containing protein n=1 Tax=Rhizophlyctis rosea TaxID=64517 RepID=A0AAD5X552_9FUNG|nr:hypothetical protein HK097_006471 [Rhizophlyctis rosea]